MRAHPRRTYSVTRMPEPEINLMSFMLPFSLSKLAKRWEVLYCIRQLKKMRRRQGMVGGRPKKLVCPC